jgi:transcriptional regulator of arginine metabolism
MYDGSGMRDTRQQLIRQLLGDQAIGTQRALRAALRGAGQHVDQSTLSRDLAELGVRKRDGRYVLPAPEAAAPHEVDLSGAVLSFLPCGPHLLVVRTALGQAQPVGVAIDRRQDPAIVATLAGDDTLFVATRNRKTQAVALRRLEAWFGDKREQ